MLCSKSIRIFTGLPSSSQKKMQVYFFNKTKYIDHLRKLAIECCVTEFLEIFFQCASIDPQSIKESVREEKKSILILLDKCIQLNFVLRLCRGSNVPYSPSPNVSDVLQGDLDSGLRKGVTELRFCKLQLLARLPLRKWIFPIALKITCTGVVMLHNSHILLATASLLAEGENKNKVYMTKCHIKDYTLQQFMLFSSNHHCASVSQCCFCNENRLFCSEANLQEEW